LVRSRALETLAAVSPVGSAKWVSFSPIAAALWFIASMKAPAPPG
jgi:hypothetical protein